MRQIQIITLSVISVFSPLALLAQESLPKHVIQESVAGIYDFHSDEWNWKGIVILDATILGATSAYHHADKSWQVGTKKEIFGNMSPVLSGIGYGFAALPAGFLAAGLLSSQEDESRSYNFGTAREMFESLVYTGGTTYILKYSVGRKRPNASDHQSFPSAHTSASFAAATTLAYRYPLYVGVPALAVAGLVGVSRIDLREHFVSDVIAGAGIGVFFATAVDFYHRGYEKVGEKQSTLLPLVGFGNYGLAWQGNF